METRISLQTSVAPDTRRGLKRIAKREKLTDHRGYPSEGRAIDFLVDLYERDSYRRSVKRLVDKELQHDGRVD